MKVLSFFQTLPKIANPAITLGMFDGLHKGHQKLLSELKDIAQKSRGQSVVITFREHPLKTLLGQSPFSIVSFDSRISLLENFGIDVCMVIDFDWEVAKISPESFIEYHLIRRLGISDIVTGENASFGYKGRGDVTMLKKWAKKSYRVHVAGLCQLKDGTVISSTNVRKAVQKGQMHRAADMLGRPFQLVGRVVSGNSRGRELGFPTANIKPFHSLIPCEGVYCGYSIIEQKHPALISIGKCPTFKQNGQLKLEVYLDGFSGNLYDKCLKTYLWEKIRDQQTFADKEALCAQMHRDREYLRKIWLEYSQNFPARAYPKINFDRL